MSIGIYDSGIGGLTVLQEIRSMLPNENIIYVGDTARIPYGAKDADTLFSYGKEIVRFLLNKGAKIIVLACGTTSSTIFERLQAEFPDTTFVDVIRPAVIACAKMAKENPHLRWGFIATSATIRSGLFVSMLKAKSENIVIHARACPLFASMVEAGINAPHFAFNFVAETYLGDLRNQIDALVLGCTHYPLMNFKPILGDIKYINLATYVAKATKEHIKSTLGSREKATPSLSQGSVAGLCPVERRGFGGIEPDRRQRRMEEGRDSLSVRQERAEAKFESTAKSGRAPIKIEGTIEFYVSSAPETFAKAVRIIICEDLLVELTTFN